MIVYWERRKHRSDGAAARLDRFLSQAALITWAAICLLPLYWIVATSIKQPLDVIDGPRYLPFVDFWPSLDSWKFILFNPTDDTLRRYANSVIVASVSTAATVLIGASAAYGLSRLRTSVTIGLIDFCLVSFGLLALAVLAGVNVGVAMALAAAVIAILGLARWRLKSPIGAEFIYAGILATRILPPVATVLPIYYVVQRVGLYDTLPALILVYIVANLPIAIWLLRGFFAEVPAELEDAAQLDGASRFQIFFGLFLPLIRGGLGAAAILIFILCWNEYVLSLYLTADHALTMPPFLAGQMAVREQMASSEPEWGYFSVLIVLMIAPLILFTGVLQRVVIRRLRA